MILSRKLQLFRKIPDEVTILPSTDGQHTAGVYAQQFSSLCNEKGACRYMTQKIRI